MKRLLLSLFVLGFFAIPLHASLENEITAENVIALMNAHRAEAGLPPLIVHPSLTRAAEARMREMEDGGWWGHRSPDGTPPFAFIPLDYDYVTAAENLAAGFETARLLVQSWMESPGHRANILGGQFAECGVAIIDGRTGGPAMGKSIVVMFGRRKVQLVSEK